MKILLPFTDPYNRAITHEVCSGGTEMFCKNINDNFDTIVHQVPYESINYPIIEKKKISRQIINHAEDINADVIISNFAQTIYSGKEIITSHIPIMMIDHIIYPMSSCITRWNKAIENGHSVFFVSEWQQKKYKLMAERTNQSVVKHSGYIRPGYVKIKQEIPSEQIYDCSTIGRCDSKKAPFKLKQLTKETELKTLVITSTTQLEKDKPYYERNKHWDNVLLNKPYNEVIENVSKSKSFFSTWNSETYGLTSLEALSCGVPVILNADKSNDHASTIIPASNEHYKVIPHDNKEELIKAIKSFENVDRKEIQEMTLEKHDRDAWKKHFENNIDITIENFKKIDKPSLL